MEPAAPGTEDDTVQPTFSKKKFSDPMASDDERLLSIKNYLSSGRYGNVFSKSYNDGMEQWYCNICECPVMGRMFHHETGKRHTQQLVKMEQRFRKDGSKESRSKIEEAKPQVKEEENLFGTMGSGMDLTKVNVAPGEPVPPGVEGDSTKVAQIQDRLDKFKASALLGLEYLLEITDYDVSREPSYLCALCDKKGDPRTVIAHLVSYNHLQQFMQRHFPSTYRALSPFITRQYRKNWQDTMNSIAEAIETKYGRLLPHPVDKDTFEKRKDFYYQMIHMGPHFSEKNGITFEHMIKPEEITKNCDDDPTADASKKRSPSPPVVAKPNPKRSRPESVRGRRSSLSSVSSISSVELNEINDCAGKDSRPAGRGRERDRGGPARPARRNSRGSKSMSISPDNNATLGRSRTRSKSRDRSRYQNSNNPRYNPPNRGGGSSGGYRGSSNIRGGPNTRGGSNARGAPYNPRYHNRRSRSPRSRSPRSRSPQDRNDRRLPWERSNYAGNSRPTSNRSPPSGRANESAGKVERVKTERETKIEEYNRLGKAIENDMSRVLKGHEKNPEKHKDYNEEWKLFWNKRYKELQVEGKDAANYDFKPEWIIVWNKRMMELHNVDVKVKKEALRRRLGLREEPAPISFRIGKHSPSKGPAPVAAQPDQDHEVIIIDDREDDGPDRAAPTITDKSSPARSHSPWETDVPPASQAAIVKKVGVEIVPTGKPPDSTSNKTEKSSSKSRDRRQSSRSPDHRRPLTKSSRDRSAERTLDRDIRKRSPANSGSRDRDRDRDRDVRSSAPASSRDRERVISLDRDRDSRDRERRYDIREGRGRADVDREGRLSWERERRGRSRSPPLLSPSDRDRYYRERELRDRERELRERERDMRERDRDLRDPRDADYYRERSWERVINQHREMRMVPHPHAVVPDPYRPPMVMRDVTSQPMHYMPPNMQMPMHSQRIPSPEIDIPDDDVTIVSVLRLLTALEEMLGSLGPKIIEMLATALAMEKSEPNSCETMLDNDINCVLFETVKEKMKGRLQAGLVTYKQEKAVKYAIKSLASLVHQASERKRIKLQQAALNPVSVPGIGVVDKAAIAKQIATALVLQGKTDVTQGELEQLINAVVGMAEASKNSDTPINTAAFLTRCREKTPEFTPKIIIPTVLKEKEKERERLRLAELDAAAKLEAMRADELAGNTSTNKQPEEENNAMEGLSDSDLQTLLQNFKDLSTDEQHGLISYLKKLESREPQRVEKLRQFVNMGKPDSTEDQQVKGDNELEELGLKKASDKEDVSKAEQAKIKFESDEEEYSYEDVFKVAKQNVTKKEKEEEEEKARRKAEMEEEEKKSMEINLDQAKMIIANLMGTISKAAEAQAAAAQAAAAAQVAQSEIKPTNLLGFISKTTQILDANQEATKQESTVDTTVELKVKDPALLVQSNILDKPDPSSRLLNLSDTSQLTPLGQSSSNSNSSESRLHFEAPSQSQLIQFNKVPSFESALTFEFGNRSSAATESKILNTMNPLNRDTELRLENATNILLNPGNRDLHMRSNEASVRGPTNVMTPMNVLAKLGGNLNPIKSSLNTMNLVTQNRFEFQPQQQSGGRIPPPPPQPPGSNPFELISYPTLTSTRNYSGGPTSDNTRFGGVNNDPPNRSSSDNARFGRGLNNDPLNRGSTDNARFGGGFNNDPSNRSGSDNLRFGGGLNNDMANRGSSDNVRFGGGPIDTSNRGSSDNVRFGGDFNNDPSNRGSLNNVRFGRDLNNDPLNRGGSDNGRFGGDLNNDALNRVGSDNGRFGGDLNNDPLNRGGSDSMRFGGLNNDPQNRSSSDNIKFGPFHNDPSSRPGFNPFQDSPRGGFNMNNMNQPQQQQNNQNQQRDCGYNNRW